MDIATWRASSVASTRYGECNCPGRNRSLARHGLKCVRDILHDPRVLRLGAWRISLDHLALAADEELFEVPLDVARDAGLGRREIAIERMAVGAIHVELGAHGERDAIGRAAELCDLLLRTWFLRTKLIARETDDGEILVVQLALQ